MIRALRRQIEEILLGFRRATDMANLRDKACAIDPPFIGTGKYEPSLLKQKVEIPVLEVEKKHANDLVKALSGHVLKVPKIVPVAGGSLPDLRSIKLVPGADIAKILSSEKVTTLTIPDDKIRRNSTTVDLDIEHYSAHQIFRAFLPQDIEIPKGYEQVGHIIHLNLRTELLPYKSMIGEVLLKKFAPGVRTIVNKTSNINTKFRFFEMELLAGEPDYDAEVKESGCIFTVPFNRAYWNSRLHTEHARLWRQVGKNDVLVDMMAGVGPFIVPAVKFRHCTVYANDLNEESYKAMLQNVVRNLKGGAQEKVHAYNLDAAEFLWQVRDVPMTHVTMNLPASAVTFLSAFKGLFVGTGNQKREQGPMIHCYMFIEPGQTDEVLKQRSIKKCEEHMGISLDGYIENVHDVRDVSPSKNMTCVSFRLPMSYALDSSGKDPRKREATENGEGAAVKRLRPETE